MLDLCILAPKEVCFIMLKNDPYIDDLSMSLVTHSSKSFLNHSVTLFTSY